MLKRNAVSNLIGQAYVNLLQFAFVPVYVHYIGIAGFGLVGLYSIIYAAFNLLDFGMTPTLTREIARFTGGGSDPETLRNFLRSLEWCGLAGFALVCGLALVFGRTLSQAWISSPDVSPDSVWIAVGITALVASLRVIEGIYRGCLGGLQQQVTLNLLSAGTATLRGLGTVVVLATYSPTIEAYFICQFVAAAATTMLFALVARSRLPVALRHGRFDRAALSHFKRFAGGMFTAALAGTALILAEKLTLTKLLSLEEFGYYALASLVASAILSFVYPVGQAWAPRLAQLHASDQLDAFARTYHLGAQVVAVLAGSAAIWLITFAEPILTLWTGKPAVAENTYRLVQILALANLLNGLVTMPVQAQIAYKHLRLVLAIDLVSLILIVPVLLLMTRTYGTVGAVLTLVMLHIGTFFVITVFAFRQVMRSERWRWLATDLALPLAAAAATAAGLRWMLNASGVPDLLQLGLSPPLIAGAAGLAAPDLRAWAARLARSRR